MEGLPAAVVFDLDDTLIVDDDAVVAALYATCNGAGPPAERLFAAVWAAAHSLWLRPGSLGELVAGLGVRPLEALLSASIRDDPALVGPGEEFRRAVWAGALAAEGLRDPALGIVLARRFREEALARYRARPGCREVLAALRGQAKLGLITNGPTELQREKLGRCDLAGEFDAILVSAEEGVAKPDERIFRRALERLEVQADQALMVGNSPTEDALGAIAAGMTALLVGGPGDEEGAANGVARIASIGQLPAALVGAVAGGRRQ